MIVNIFKSDLETLQALENALEAAHDWGDVFCTQTIGGVQDLRLTPLGFERALALENLIENVSYARESLGVFLQALDNELGCWRGC